MRPQALRRGLAAACIAVLVACAPPQTNFSQRAGFDSYFAANPPRRETEASYRLDALPHDDAFYGFKGFLGERRRFQGRSGPPGAGYNIWPSAKGKTTEMLIGYWHEDDVETLRAIDEASRSTVFPLHFAQLRREQFLRDLACVRRGAPRC